LLIIAVYFVYSLGSKLFRVLNARNEGFIGSRGFFLIALLSEQLARLGICLYMIGDRCALAFRNAFFQQIVGVLGGVQAFLRFVDKMRSLLWQAEDSHALEKIIHLSGQLLTIFLPT